MQRLKNIMTHLIFILFILFFSAPPLMVYAETVPEFLIMTEKWD